ncbi:hypothetical protein [Priestia endophytica]|uniref:hypothetical protein n=1 Tax=Priestia endophytica TaxID=135735 RepID=UPI000DCA3F9F|nr:hypothetical protein [Priestia endophytica]RAS83087.1 hypothetical protein A4R27_08050 [Priestia endophytica]
MRKGTYSSDSNSESIYWCSELYKKCYSLEESVVNNIQYYLSIDMLELDRDYQEAYEGILFAVVCEIGGHRGHFEYLHSTNCVQEYIIGEITTEEFIAVIKEIVNNNLALNDRRDTITINDAIISLEKEIESYREYMSEALTTISGSAQPVLFERFEPLLKFINEKDRIN